MALINCKECNKEISSTVKTCPHCGFSNKSSSTLSGGAKAVFLSLALLIIYFLVKGPAVQNQDNKPLEQIDLQALAKQQCKDFVTQTLHDPASAEFADESTATVMQDTANEWTVKRIVRAKNGFNALRQFNIECKVRLEGSVWSPVSINELTD